MDQSNTSQQPMPPAAESLPPRQLPQMSPARYEGHLVAPPTTSAAMPVVWRHGGLLITATNVRLNDYCIKCNAHVGEQRMKRTIYWHHPAIFLSILAGLLIYVILALILRKRAIVHLGLCAKHRGRRRLHIAISWLVVLASIGMFVLAVSNDVGVLALAGVVMFFGGLIYAVVTVPLLKPVRMDDHWARFKGCSQEYLAAYPVWPNR